MRTGKERSVQIYSPAAALKLEEEAVRTVFEYLDQHAPYSIPAGELSLAFLQEEQHNQLHADFLDDPSSTDVITFPGDPDEEMAGEICVSIDTAYSYSQEHGIDFSRELTLYLVHGWLHLAGFNDLNEEERQVMKKEEHVCMSLLETNSKIPMFKYNIHA